MKRVWWKESVIYQIYPRSFNDSNNDGIGDLQGIIQKLDYIKSLGVDIIWLCPVYESPNDDNGYDISDYRAIMPEFGTMADFDELLDGVHQRGMKLIMDLVANHSSDEHHWFQESRKSADNPYRDYYIWKKGKNGQEPNDWTAFFSGSAWEKDGATDEYYLHLFTKKQPDLNWENPKVRQEIYDIIKYWFDKGIDGFRMDVISLISKDLKFPDAISSDFGEVIKKQYANGPRIHEFLHEMNQEVLSKYDIMTVGEGPGITLETGADYVNEDRQELNMVFHFDHVFMGHGEGGKFDPIPWKLTEFKQIFSDWDERLKNKGWGSIFLGNHDFPRIVSRFGNDGPYWEQSAKLLATLLLTLRGTVYIYQGDEIGMTNIAFDSIDDYRDVETINVWKEAVDQGKDLSKFLKNVHIQSRDNARTPIQWGSEKNSGFSSSTPWIKVNPNFPKINVQRQESEQDSILNYYRRMIQFRKVHKTLVYGDYTCLMESDEELYCYQRNDKDGIFLILLNFSENQRAVDFNIPKSAVVAFGNYTESNPLVELRPWEAKVVQYN